MGTKPEPARPRARPWMIAVGAGLCLVVLGAVLLRWKSPPPLASKILPPRPCTLGALPPDASADGGIIAVLVSSTYPLPKPPSTPVSRFVTPVPMATTMALCVLRASDGAELAHFGLDGLHLTPGAAAVHVAPDGSALYVSSATGTQSEPGSGRICALHPRSGTALWCADLDAFPLGVVVTRHDLYVATFHSFTALDAASGTVRWRNAAQLPAYPEYSLSQSGNLLIGVSGDDIAPTDEVCAWRVADGSVAWCTHTYQDVVVQAVAVDAGDVTMGMSFADNSGLVEQLSAQNGTLLWTQRLPASRVSRIADGNGIVYLMPLPDCVSSSATCQSTVLMLRAATGASAGRFSVVGEVRDFTVGQAFALALTHAPDSLVGIPVPGAPSPPASFVFHPHGFDLYAVAVLGASALYTGPDRLGLLRLAGGAPIWEADSCGDALAGTATATVRGGTTMWCHWPPGSRVIQAAIQGADTIL